MGTKIVDRSGKIIFESKAEITSRSKALMQAIGEKVSLKGAVLPNLRLSDSDLTRANLIGARLSGSIFRGCVITNCIFTDAEMIGVNFVDAFLDDTDFQNANLRKANFTGAEFHNCSLGGIMLEGAKGIIQVGPLGPFGAILYCTTIDGDLFLSYGEFSGHINRLRDYLISMKRDPNECDEALVFIKSWAKKQKKPN